jgi:hypothetical protein
MIVVVKEIAEPRFLNSDSVKAITNLFFQNFNQLIFFQLIS